VEKDGSLTDIKVLRDIGYGTGKEAVKCLTKPDAVFKMGSRLECYILFRSKFKQLMLEKEIKIFRRNRSRFLLSSL
jgi:hypothetical protein